MDKLKVTSDMWLLNLKPEIYECIICGMIVSQIIIEIILDFKCHIPVTSITGFASTLAFAIPLIAIPFINKWYLKNGGTNKGLASILLGSFIECVISLI